MQVLRETCDLGSPRILGLSGSEKIGENRGSVFSYVTKYPVFPIKRADLISHFLQDFQSFQRFSYLYPGRKVQIRPVIFTIVLVPSCCCHYPEMSAIFIHREIIKFSGNGTCTSLCKHSVLITDADNFCLQTAVVDIFQPGTAE